MVGQNQGTWQVEGEGKVSKKLIGNGNDNEGVVIMSLSCIKSVSKCHAGEPSPLGRAFVDKYHTTMVGFYCMLTPGWWYTGSILSESSGLTRT